MQRCFCDGCGTEVGDGADARYTVRMESRRVNVAAPTLTDTDLDGQDDPDHLDAIDDMLSDLEADCGGECDRDEMEAANLAPPPHATEFDLCGNCYHKFSTDPLGLRRTRKVQYSTN